MASRLYDRGGLCWMTEINKIFYGGLVTRLTQKSPILDGHNLSTTPNYHLTFGIPVLPDVYIMIATSFRVGGTGAVN